MTTTDSRRRVAVVTGASRGLGAETCRQLAQRGLTVCLTSRGPDGRAVADDLAAQGLDVVYCPLDVTDPDSVGAAAAFARDRWGGADVLVDNAGVSMRGFDVDVVRGTMAVNYRGAVRVTDAMLPVLREPAAIVMVSSGMGELACLGPERRRAFADPDLDRGRLDALVDAFEADVAAGRHGERGWPSSAYRVSKVALNAFVRVLDRELRAASRDVIVNAVCPGWVRTDMGGAGADRDVAEGASGIVWAAMLPPGGPSGGFYRDGRAIEW